MKLINLLYGCAAASMATAAFAAEGSHEDGSSLAVSIFLAFCALIVVGQLLPIFRIRLKRKKELAAAKETVRTGTAHNRP